MAEEYEMSKRPFTLTCPECGGALGPATGEPVPRYVCHVGHSLTWPALVDAQLTRIEFQLCAALVQVKERAELCRQLAETGEIGADTAERMIAEALARAEKLKELLSSTWSTIPPGARPPD